MSGRTWLVSIPAKKGFAIAPLRKIYVQGACLGAALQLPSGRSCLEFTEGEGMAHYVASLTKNQCEQVALELVLNPGIQYRFFARGDFPIDLIGHQFFAEEGTKEGIPSIEAVSGKGTASTPARVTHGSTKADASVTAVEAPAVDLPPAIVPKNKQSAPTRSTRASKKKVIPAAEADAVSGSCEVPSADVTSPPLAVASKGKTTRARSTRGSKTNVVLATEVDAVSGSCEVPPRDVTSVPLAVASKGKTTRARSTRGSKTNVVLATEVDAVSGSCEASPPDVTPAPPAVALKGRSAGARSSKNKAISMAEVDIDSGSPEVLVDVTAVPLAPAVAPKGRKSRSRQQTKKADAPTTGDDAATDTLSTSNSGAKEEPLLL
ncbi:hypothetical protein DFP72DRAFT_844792 [Ephemerocybe angulata]|uniref:Nucleoplasmin-like domain-containing protein n=1 Tax=Ephemerocybe angulata TaxID=980116 RepID=A0A8H6I598_9AGAR|nr:hypothetical protein DFP72DRAFT_844792 [Tulosesus angulatus]